VSSPVGGLGSFPRKKNQFCAKKYAILSKFWYFFPILQQKVGGLSPVLKVGDLSPCLACFDAYARAGSVIVRIDQLHFLAGCRTRRLNQALSVISQHIFSVLMFIMAPFYVSLICDGTMFSLLVLPVKVSVLAK